MCLGANLLLPPGTPWGSVLNKNFCHPAAGPRDPGYARKARTNNKDFMTWVPQDAPGMTRKTQSRLWRMLCVGYTTRPRVCGVILVFLSIRCRESLTLTFRYIHAPGRAGRLRYKPRSGDTEPRVSWRCPGHRGQQFVIGL